MADLTALRQERNRCVKEFEEAASDARASNARLSAVLIRLRRAERALELAEDEAKEETR